MDAPRTRAYILERTRDYFAGQPDEPCLGAARFEPANSGAALLRSATSTAAMRSSARGLILRPLRWSGLILGPRQ
jgi:hypothetical protein